MNCETLGDFCVFGRWTREAHELGQFDLAKRYRSEMNAFIDKNYSDRKGDWTVFSSGRPFWPLDPRPEDIWIEDIVDGLRGICRYCGHTKWHYSVAQHSYLVSIAVNPRFALAGLLHDAPEALLGDVITPVKKLIKDVYGKLEDDSMRAIATKFDFLYDEETHTEVKIADEILLATELRDVSNAGFINAFTSQLPMKVKIEPWCPEYAKKMFLERFTELTNGRYPIREMPMAEPVRWRVHQ